MVSDGVCDESQKTLEVTTSGVSIPVPLLVPPNTGIIPGNAWKVCPSACNPFPNTTTLTTSEPLIG